MYECCIVVGNSWSDTWLTEMYPFLRMALGPSRASHWPLLCHIIF